MSEIDLRALKAELLQEEILGARADAGLKALELATAKRNESSFLAQSKYAREYTFHSPVTSMTAADAVQTLGHWSRRDPGQPMTIIFNSPGGSVFEGLAFYDFIQKLRRDGHYITTKGTGMAASMGGVLLQAGDERVIDANAFMLIHEVSSLAWGTSSAMEDELKFIKRLQDRLLEILAFRSTLSKGQIARRWKKTDWWLDAQEALELGFVDAVE